MTVDEGVRMVGRGWSPLIKIIVSKINGDRIFDIKEKYGTLSVYLNSGGTDQEYEFIEAIERLSGTICESCGKIGTIRETSWIKTLCNKCYEKRQNDLRYSEQE